MPQSEHIRPPRQERSRIAWERVLEAGAWILENEGREALTVSAVCSRAEVFPTTIYRRVDGLTGLFWAIYDQGMARVAETYSEQLDRAERCQPGSDERVLAVVQAAVETFERHRRFLTPIITQSLLDPALKERGSRESMAFLQRMASVLGSAVSHASVDVARLLHQENVFRAMYGNQWLSAEPESLEEFSARLANLAFARLGYDEKSRSLGQLNAAVERAVA